MAATSTHSVRTGYQANIIMDDSLNVPGGRPTKKTTSIIWKNWHERSAFQSVGVRATTLVACIKIFFSHFISVATFSHRRNARIKKLILRKLTGTPKNLGVDTFPDPLCHFGAPWRPFWILQAVRRCRRLASAPSAARLGFLTVTMQNTIYSLQKNLFDICYKHLHSSSADDHQRDEPLGQ